MAIIYVSPTGSGAQSGSSAANALPVGSLDKAIQLAGPGGTVKMLADRGAYDLTSSIWISHGGTARAPVTIMGVDSAGNEMNIQINGTRPADYVAGMESGNEIFKLIDGADNLVFENMNFANVGVAFRAGADIRNIVIQDMYADNVQRFFEDYVSGSASSATVTDLTIRNVEVHGFSKGVIRLQYDTHDVLIENVWGDSERQDGDGIAIGVHLEGTVHDVTIRDTTMMNAQASTDDDYWNGDGFATERSVYSVTFENTTAIGNADGGYDLKSTNTTLINAVAEDNGRNFRLWGEATLIDPIGIDPHKWGGSTGGQIQMQIMSGAEVTVTGGNFADSGSATIVVVNDGGTVTFSGTHFAYAAGGRLKGGSGSSGTVGIDAILVETTTATGAYSTNGETLIEPVSQYGGTAGDDLFVATGAEDWRVNGLAGKDRLTTLGGADTICGGAGDDVIAAGSGNDTITFSGNREGFDAIDGGTGDDRIIALANGTTIGLTSVSSIETIAANGFSNVTISGSGGADTLDFSNAVLNGIAKITGGAGADFIVGSAGNDVIAGNAGNDTLDGNAGSDTAVYSGMFSNYSVAQNSDGSWSVVDLRRGSPDGSDTLSNIEFAQFSDFLKTLGSQTQPPSPPSQPSSNNAAPVIVSATATGAVTEWADKSANETADTPHTASGSVTYADANALDTHTASFKPKGAGYLGTFSLDTSAIDSGDTIGWSFTVSDSAMDSLKAGRVKTQVYDVTIDDGHGGTILQTITITLTGADDAVTRTRRPRANDLNPAQDLGSPANAHEHGRHGDGHDAAPAPDLAALLGAHLHPGDYLHV